MSINRRDFLKTASVTGMGILAGQKILTAKPALTKAIIGKQAIVDRMAFGCWINDVRTEPLPFDSWPPVILDDIAEQSLIKTMDLQAKSGYNIFDVWGLFAAFGWPVDIVSAVDKDRDVRVRRIMKAARNRGIKLVYGLGVYSWGFDKIIEHDPKVKGPNPHAMCGSREESWQWQKKIIDFIMKYDFDGYHLEASDLGRCTCEECMKKWPVQATYYNEITGRCADYIRSKDPSKYIAAITISWADWNTGFTEEDKNNLVELSKKVDTILDQGHHGTFIKEPDRKAFIERLHCKFGTSGGYWVYPPFRCHRLRWFLPYTKKTGTHIKGLYADGGRTVLYYQGPVTNPGAEVNMAFGGKIMSDTDRKVEDVLAEVLDDLYKPKNAEAAKKLLETFQLGEDAYFSNQDYDADGIHHKGLQAYPAPGEQHIGFSLGLAGGASAVPVYIYEPFLTDKGRAGYAKGLETCLRNVCDIEDKCGDTERIQRLKSSIYHAFDDVSNLAYARETAKKA